MSQQKSFFGFNASNINLNNNNSNNNNNTSNDNTKKLKGKVFMFDVTIPDAYRHGIIPKIERLGGQVEVFFSKKITHLITKKQSPGEPISLLVENARTFNTKIIPLDVLLKVLQKELPDDAPQTPVPSASNNIALSSRQHSANIALLRENLGIGTSTSAAPPATMKSLQDQLREEQQASRRAAAQQEVLALRTTLKQQKLPFIILEDLSGVCKPLWRQFSESEQGFPTLSFADGTLPFGNEQVICENEKKKCRSECQGNNTNKVKQQQQQQQRQRQQKPDHSVKQEQVQQIQKQQTPRARENNNNLPKDLQQQQHRQQTSHRANEKQVAQCNTPAAPVTAVEKRIATDIPLESLSDGDGDGEGWCECCKKSFNNYAKHVKSARHLQYANNNEKFKEIDEIIRQTEIDFLAQREAIARAATEFSRIRSTPSATNNNDSAISTTTIVASKSVPKQTTTAIATEAATTKAVNQSTAACDNRADTSATSTSVSKPLPSHHTARSNSSKHSGTSVTNIATTTTFGEARGRARMVKQRVTLELSKGSTSSMHTMLSSVSLHVEDRSSRPASPERGNNDGGADEAQRTITGPPRRISRAVRQHLQQQQQQSRTATRQPKVLNMEQVSVGNSTSTDILESTADKSDNGKQGGDSLSQHSQAQQPPPHRSTTEMQAEAEDENTAFAKKVLDQALGPCSADSSYHDDIPSVASSPKDDSLKFEPVEMPMQHQGEQIEFSSGENIVISPCQSSQEPLQQVNQEQQADEDGDSEGDEEKGEAKPKPTTTTSRLTTRTLRQAARKSGQKPRAFSSRRTTTRRRSAEVAYDDDDNGTTTPSVITTKSLAMTRTPVRQITRRRASPNLQRTQPSPSTTTTTAALASTTRKSRSPRSTRICTRRSPRSIEQSGTKQQQQQQTRPVHIVADALLMSPSKNKMSKQQKLQLNSDSLISSDSEPDEDYYGGNNNLINNDNDNDNNNNETEFNSMKQQNEAAYNNGDSDNEADTEEVEMKDHHRNEQWRVSPNTKQLFRDIFGSISSSPQQRTMDDAEEAERAQEAQQRPPQQQSQHHIAITYDEDVEMPSPVRQIDEQLRPCCTPEESLSISQRSNSSYCSARALESKASIITIRKATRGSGSGSGIRVAATTAITSCMLSCSQQSADQHDFSDNDYADENNKENTSQDCNIIPPASPMSMSPSPCSSQQQQKCTAAAAAAFRQPRRRRTRTRLPLNNISESAQAEDEDDEEYQESAMAVSPITSHNNTCRKSPSPRSTRIVTRGGSPRSICSSSSNLSDKDTNMSSPAAAATKSRHARNTEEFIRSKKVSMQPPVLSKDELRMPTLTRRQRQRLANSTTTSTTISFTSSSSSSASTRALRTRRR